MHILQLMESTFENISSKNVVWLKSEMKKRKCFFFTTRSCCLLISKVQIYFRGHQEILYVYHISN